MEKYICIHGHFYQPPRENAWLEVIEQQDSAYPYHDWNERITHECYGPNGASRILDSDKHITDIRNNYARMSFNFGPTLLQWMQLHAPEAYRNVIDSDALSLRLFDGHGSALAQVYNHIIMPLANRRDKETQVRWGIADFESRFGRKPEGMWLAETAVDTETSRYWPKMKSALPFSLPVKRPEFAKSEAATGNRSMVKVSIPENRIVANCPRANR